MDCKHFGVMLDCSRCGVLKPEKVKEFVDYISAFGYNTLELYTEDTFEVEGEPYFGYMRGRYSVEELQDIDAYCKSKGVELIPCVQTLAHLCCIFKWKEYSKIKDAKDIMLIGDERTYQLIENIFKTLSKAFTSRYVNIGMDEAEMVGLGKYLEKNGYKDRFEILKGHLERVIEIAKKYGFTPHMWSDMFFKFLNGTYDVKPKQEVKKELDGKIPQGVNLTMWNYYSWQYKNYNNMLKVHKQLDQDCWFAGATWSWRGFAPNNGWTKKSMTPAMKACRDNNIEHILITAWGDDGNDCSYFSVLPSLFYIIKNYQGETSMAKIKREFKAITGEDYDAFYFQDKPNVLCGVDSTFCPSKYITFSDVFNGFLDPFIPEQTDSVYKGYAKRLRKYAKTSQKFGYLYDNLAKLCDFISVKGALGIKLRKAYKAGDKAQLAILLGELNKAIIKLDKFYNSFMTRWYIENKPEGADVHDIRLGGLKQRLISCKNRLNDYLQGKLDNIPELETELLKEDNYGDKLSPLGMWVTMATVQPLKNNGY